MQAVSQHSERGCLHGNSDVHRWSTDFNRKGEIFQCHLRFHYGSETVNPKFNKEQIIVA